MGNHFSLPLSSSCTYKTINFEDIQHVINDNDTLLINTLDASKQSCLIVGTLPIENETKIMNEQLTKNKNIRIVIYGMNAMDETILRKYEQLHQLGFTNVFLYLGGLFEWLLLQDIYTFKLFPTTANERDILKYKGHSQFNTRLLRL